MFRIRTVSLAAFLACVLFLSVPVSGAEVEAGSVYCFGADDFSQEEGLTGVCITALPQSSLGMLTLGSREIRCGDILTAEQTEQLIFSPLLTPTDHSVQIRYLPIYENRVAPCSTMTVSIRGREDKSPVAEDSTAETYKNLASTGNLKVTDPEGQPLTYTVTRQPRRGTVTLDPGGSFTYTPKKNKVGVDSFTFTATDPAGNVSREATVTVTILKPTDAPQYTDTAGRDCSFAAEWMKHTGIFVGETLGDQSCFQPDKEVTRGEFVSMLVKALEIPTDEYLTYTGYTDEIPTWLQPYLAAAVRSGLTAGLSGKDVFGAGHAVTGDDAAVMLCNALQTEDLSGLELSLETDAPLTRDTVSRVLYQSARILRAREDGTLV